MYEYENKLINVGISMFISNLYYTNVQKGAQICQKLQQRHAKNNAQK